MGDRYRLKFSKKEKMKFIGHLDLLRLFQRAVNRAELPVGYSAGFNPHQIISFALPLPIGMEGLGEYADIEMERAVAEEELVAGLNAQMPRGLQIITAKKLGTAERNGAAIVQAADYEICVSQPLSPDAVERLLAQDEVIAQKKTKSGHKTVDIKPDILDAAWSDGCLTARLSAGSTNFLKPQLLVACLYGEQPFDPFSVSYVRKGLLMKTKTKTGSGWTGLLTEA